MGRAKTVLNARSEVMKATSAAKTMLERIERAQQALLENHEPAANDLAIAIKALRAIASSYGASAHGDGWCQGLAKQALGDIGVKVRP